MASWLLPLDAQGTIKNPGAAQPGSGLGCLPSLVLPQKNFPAHQPLQTIVRGVVSGASSRRKAPPVHPGMLSLFCHFVTVIKENHFAPDHGSTMQSMVSGFTQFKMLLPHSMLHRCCTKPLCPLASAAEMLRSQFWTGRVCAGWDGVCPCHPNVTRLQGHHPAGVKTVLRAPV